MVVLVTGGTGYIGSHTAAELLSAGHTVVLVDDLSNSKADVPQRIGKITGIKPSFYQADCKDKNRLNEIFRAHRPDAVVHFAGFKAVGESCKKPLEYYRNNLDSTLTLLEAMRENGCNAIVFSSSATVYGSDNQPPLCETMPALQSSNPYGWTKVMIERILRDYAAANPDFSAVLLRYFNPIGSHESGLLGDDPSGIPNNLMPYIARVAAGQLERLTIFGNDYPTPDGTCLRDYLHVVDLAKGHLCAISYAAKHTGAEAINLGTGQGVSVLELVNAFKKANEIDVPYTFGARRDGDLPAMWADADKARRLLGWQAECTLEQMCRSAWNFVKSCQ